MPADADRQACRADLEALISAWVDRGVSAATAGYALAEFGLGLLAIAGESWNKFVGVAVPDWVRRGGAP